MILMLVLSTSLIQDKTMKAFIAVVKWDGDRLAKYADFDTQAEAIAHIAEFGGFVAPSPGGGVMFWVVDPVAETLVHDQAAEDEHARQERRSIVFDDFEARFTTQEWDDATDYVKEIDTTTGKPKRRVLVQGLERAVARNSVDLLDAKTDSFLGLLVSGGVITETRKDEILTP